VVVEAFVGFGQQPSAPIQRVVFAVPMPDRFVLDAAAALIELVVREFHDMERVCDLDRVGHHRVEHHPIRARPIERRPFNLGEPRVAAEHLTSRRVHGPGEHQVLRFRICRPVRTPHQPANVTWTAGA
jgi:hypothetical protein